MANYGSKDVAFLLVGGYSLLSETGEIRDKVSAVLDPKLLLGTAWREHAYTGLREFELSQAGYFDDAANGSNAALVGLTGVPRVVCYGLEGNTLGKRFNAFSGALQVDYERIASLGKLHRASAAYRGVGQMDPNGIILHPLGARTVDYNGEADDSFDASAGSSDGGAAYLQVVSFSGFSGAVVKVRHSADDSTFADLATFTTVASAPTAERVVVTGTVNRYLAVDVNVTGTGSIALLVGFKRF